MDFEPGVFVTPTIRLVRLLGQGGMGSVWVADHGGLHTQVAVKFMAEELATNEDAVRRFTREAAAAARVKSPHIVQVFDHGVTDRGIPYIVMELMEGHDITHQVEKHGPLSVVATAHVLAQACRALQKAHDAGIIHRDIKPDNVFLTDPDGEPFVKVLDFGIAKDSKMTELGMTGTGAMVGTPYYMSPEQVMSAKHVDHRTDVWAITLVAYYALTGAVPYTADNLGALCVEICSGNVAAPTTFRPDLGPAVDAFFAKALTRDINQRFQTARDLAAAFDQLANRAPSFVDAPTYDGVGSMVPATPGAAGLSASQGAIRPGGSLPGGPSGVAGQTLSDLSASAPGTAAPQAGRSGGSKAALVAIPVVLLLGGALAAGAFVTFGRGSPPEPPAHAASSAEGGGDLVPAPSTSAGAGGASTAGTQPTADAKPATSETTPSVTVTPVVPGEPAGKTPKTGTEKAPPPAETAVTPPPTAHDPGRPPPAKTAKTAAPAEKDHGFLETAGAIGRRRPPWAGSGARPTAQVSATARGAKLDSAWKRLAASTGFGRWAEKPAANARRLSSSRA
jgi:eukaryotic-like serine/threonine-protein kinase